MLQNSLISVVVPCFNYSHYLPKLFHSLQNQEYKNWECLIIDDDSKDNTKQVVESFLINDNRIKYFFQKNSGPAAARKYGVELSIGEFIQFIDADDFIGDEKFKKEIELFILNPKIDVVYSQYSFVNNDLKVFWTDDKKWLTMSKTPFNDLVKNWEAGLMIPIHCYLFKKECFLNFGTFDTSFKTHEDWDLNLNFSLNGVKYLYHHYIGAYYRIHSNSSSRSDLTLNRIDTLNVLVKYLYHPKVFLLQKLILINRYSQFIVDFVIEKILYKRIRLIAVLKNQAPLWLKFYATIFFPLYLIRKIYNKVFGK